MFHISFPIIYQTLYVGQPFWHADVTPLRWRVYVYITLFATVSELSRLLGLHLILSKFVFSHNFDYIFLYPLTIEIKKLCGRFSDMSIEYFQIQYLVLLPCDLMFYKLSRG